MKNSNSIILFALSMLLIVKVNGQTKDEENLNIKEIRHETAKQVSVKESTKFDEAPEVIGTEVEKPEIKYYVIPKEVKTSYEIEPIAPAKVKVVEPLDKLYRGYAKAGIGNYMTPLAELYFNALRSKDLNYGVFLRHFSSNGGVKNAGDSGFSENKVNVFGKKFLNKHALNFELGYDRNVVHRYGFNPEKVDLSKDDIKQRYNRFAGGAKLASYYRDSTKINHEIGLSYRNLSDLFGASENYGKLDAVFKTYFSRELLEVNTFVDFANFSLDSLEKVPEPASDNEDDKDIERENQTNVLIKVNPQISTIGKNWKATVGLGIFAEMTHTSYFHFYPNAQAHYSLLNNIFIPYIGLTGKMKRNSFHSLTEENPYISNSIVIKNTNEAYDLYAGIRGTLSSKTSFSTRVGISSIIDHPFYVAYGNTFFLQYSNFTQTQITGEMSYFAANKIKVLVKGDYYIYQMESEDFAWNLPDYEFLVSGSYNLKDKIIGKIDVFVRSARKGKCLANGTDNVEDFHVADLGGYADVNLGFEYRYTRRLSAFLDINNILSQNYYIWHNYRVQGLNVLGGLTLSF